MATTVCRPRIATPERWQRALQRALAGQVQVRQLGSTGQWIATSATDPRAAYELAVTNGVVHGCSCPAATFGDDPICCHRAMFWHLAGVLDLDPEPEPPAQASTSCARCHGTGALTLAVAGGCAVYPTPVPCRACAATGEVARPLAA